MRNQSIDVLRAVAIILVLGRHATFPDNPLTAIWQRGGWVGVDLFFVLSGFLVSGLLFKDFQSTGAIHWGRFVARRGFKIYPAFYLMIAFTLLYNYWGSGIVEWRRALVECFFIQNYLPGLVGHTWSLAIEEHFYLLLPILLAASARDQFRGLPWTIAVTAMCLLTLRCLHPTFDLGPSVFATHLRLDSLLFGTLLAYIYYYHRALFDKISRFRVSLAILGVGLLAPAFIWNLDSTPAIYTVGFTGFYLGSGAILMATINGVPNWKIMDALAAMGTYSYSIYLWHEDVHTWMYPHATWIETGLYMAVSILVGIALSKLIEIPILRVRETLIPA
jgi:peptidoglycan/LPS O-acetylase OafA/YrhL